MSSRYHRQTILPGFGPDAEAKLAASHVMIVGLGALGCPAADLLARAGVGTISLVDRDLVELTNLQRQTLYAERDVNRPKAEAAAARLREINKSIKVYAIVEDFSPSNAEAMVVTHPRPDVVLDCTDNFQTRYLINDACVKHGVPLVYGGAVGTEGVQFTIRPGLTACLRCLFPDAPAPGAAPTCDTAGIFAPSARSSAARKRPTRSNCSSPRRRSATRSCDLTSGPTSGRAWTSPRLAIRSVRAARKNCSITFRWRSNRLSSAAVTQFNFPLPPRGPSISQPSPLDSPLTERSR
ncbi:MAG: HesA/MoeB/ThiF family protein [Phycisphaerales bacterium]